MGAGPVVRGSGGFTSTIGRHALGQEGVVSRTLCSPINLQLQPQGHAQFFLQRQGHIVVALLARYSRERFPRVRIGRSKTGLTVLFEGK